MALNSGCDPIFDGSGVARDAQGRPVRTTPVAASAPRLVDVDFELSPFVVVWETTQACDLACRHCRAETRPRRHPDELSTLEAMRLMNDVRQFGRPLFVLSGGDPLKRPDIVALVKHGARLGLRMALAPSGTPLVTSDLLAQLRDVGLARLAVSLDGSSADVHDQLRGVQGSWSWTMSTLAAAREAGLATQVDTTISRRNLADFDALATLVRTMDIALWSVFFLVPMGRAGLDDVISPDEFESVFERMYDLSRNAPFDIQSTAAPQYRRVILQRQAAERRANGTGEAAAPAAGRGFSLADPARAAKGVSDGNGFLFVSHTGEIYPSGFLPISAGTVRTDDVVEIYRTAALFRELRDRSRLKGKCSVCEYREVCGGSRARAYAMTGDYLEADPLCVHLPVRYQRMIEAGEALPVDAYFRERLRGPGHSSPAV